jgi:DNA-binding IclR family transcriptional regulator
VRDPATKEFRLGPELINLGEAAGRSLPVVQLARPAMVELATELGVTCAAFSAAEGVATLTDQVWDVRSTVQPLRVGIWARIKAPFGALFTTWASEDERATWVGGLDPAAAARQVAALDASKARGYVVELRSPSIALAEGSGSLAQTIVDDDFLLADIDPTASYAVSTIEAPVFDPTGRVILGLVLVGLPRTMRGTDVDAHGRRLVTATRGVTDALRA